MPNMRNVHAPGCVRDTFLAAIEAFASWSPGEPEPAVEFEVDHEPRQIPLSKACGLVWKCTDIVPGGEFDLLQSKLEGLHRGEVDLRRRTYAACARAMVGAIREAEMA
ncbi:hypothetical protein [Xanthobacter versatilis]|uniref:hypothetical protein n=1 Tax=Xanthobacter autotrophicus (strain ATCC BAA-1158 / Py2) TaxID=78245 RepID=UPI00372C96CF